MATSVTAAALVGVLASGQAVQKLTKANGALSQVVHADSTDPLLDGVDVSNGYLDNLNPIDTSTERQAGQQGSQEEQQGQGLWLNYQDQGQAFLLNRQQAICQEG